MIFCINKNVKRLEVSLLSDRSACSPPKWTFITFNGCNNNYICYLWIFNVPETLPAFDSPSTPKSSKSSIGCSPERRNSEKVFLFILMLTETSQQKFAVCGDPETEQRSPSHRHSNICRTIRGQSPSGWTAARAGPPLRWTRVGRGGGWTLTLRVCLPLKSSFTCKLLSIKRAFLR